MSVATVTKRQLNRALLERQMLLRRVRLPVERVIERLVGMQAQATRPPYYGLWSRVEDFKPDDLSQLILDRLAVRIALMRSTVHLVTARDCRILRPLMDGYLKRVLFSNAYGRQIAGVDTGRLVAVARTALEDRPLTNAQLADLLSDHWPDYDRTALVYAVRNMLPLVQVPPRGVWGAGGQLRTTTAEAWFGQPLEANPSLEEIILRYLAAFGPATVRDFQTWSGLTGIKARIEALRPRFRTFSDEAGRELFDLPDAPLPDPETPAPVRFIGEFDNVLLSHADRTRIVSDEHRKRLWTGNGLIPGSFLVDGFVAGTWALALEPSRATLELRPFDPISGVTLEELNSESERFLAFVAPDRSARTLILGLD